MGQPVCKVPRYMPPCNGLTKVLLPRHGKDCFHTTGGRNVCFQEIIATRTVPFASDKGYFLFAGPDGINESF